MALTPDERAAVAAAAVRKAEIHHVMKTRDWEIGEMERPGAPLTHSPRLLVFSCPGQEPRPLVEVLAELMVERDEWKRRAESHGCDTANGDPDCAR